MSTIIKIKRGLESNRNTIIPNLGELIYTTNNNELFVGDGISPGGNPITSANSNTFDGFTSSQFIRSDVSDIASGNHEFYSTDITGNYSNGSIELREVNLVTTTQSADAYAPALSLHWGGVSQIQVALESDGVLRIRDGATHSTLRALDASALRVNGSDVWHPGNDGPGSGLNADLLDNQSSAYFASAASVTSKIDVNSRNNYTTVGNGLQQVSSQLAWKNYGNNHTIFDASNSTSPTGVAINNTNPTNAWSAGYPTLMGYNGSNTYGVRVDIARNAENADTLDGIDSGGFVRTSGGNYNFDIASNSNSSSYSSAAIEVRELNHGSGQTGADSESPRISFRWGGRVASQIGMSVNGWIRTFNNPGTGYESFIASNIYATGNVTAYYSDGRLKDIKKPIENALNIINTWQAVHYNANQTAADLGYDPLIDEIGLITQDIEIDFPELVKDAPINVGKDTDYNTLDYNRVTAVLVAALQDQIKINNSLAARLDEIEKLMK